MAGSEHNFQQAAYNFCKAALPGKPVWSVDCGWPNDGSAKAQNTLMARKRRGILPGYPDLWIMISPMIAFETKAKDGRLSDAQLARRDELLREGHRWFGPIQALEEIEASLVSLGIKLALTTGIKARVPQVGVRREANYAKMHDPLPF